MADITLNIIYRFDYYYDYQVSQDGTDSEILAILSAEDKQTGRTLRCVWLFVICHEFW